MDKKIKTVAAVAVVAVIAIVSVYTVYDLNGKSLDLSDREVRIIITGSMDGNVTEYDIDSFPANTLVMIRHMSQTEVANDLKVGDVIAFEYSGKLLTHRIVSIDTDNKTITTKGDANAGTEVFSYGKVVGIVVGTNHPLGLVVHFLQTYRISVILAAVAIVTAGIAVSSSLKIMKEEKEEAKRAEEQQALKQDDLTEQQKLQEERMKLEEEIRKLEEERRKLQESQSDGPKE